MTEHEQTKNTPEQAAEYILWITTYYNDGGVGETWYGWSRNMVFENYEEAMQKKTYLQDHILNHNQSIEVLEVVDADDVE